jgi:hypothetical protein
MIRGERARLSRLYRERVASAIRLALDPKKSEDLKTNIEEVENYSKLLSLVEARWSADWIAAAIVAVVCLAVASFLWSTKVSATNVSMTLETESIRGMLGHDWRVDDPFQSSAMHFENLSAVQAPNLGLAINGGKGDAWFSLAGGQLTLEGLQVDQGASIQMTVDKSQVGLFVTQRGVRGKLTVLGKGTLMAGPEPGSQTVRRTYAIEVPETIEFSVVDPKGVPTRLTIHSPQKWNLGKIPLTDAMFALEETRDLSEAELVSGIKSGSVHFNDTSRPSLELSENEIVSVHRTDEARIDLRSSDGTAHVTLNGLVKDVTAGDSQTRQELAPSLLEYLYNKKSVTFFWGAIVFLWGILWGIRKTIFR